MRSRWLSLGVLAAALFAVNVVTRLVVRLGYAGDEDVENRASLLMFTAIGLIVAGVVFVRSRREPLGQWLADVAAAAAVALLLTVFIGPFVSGGTPFAGGAGQFFAQIWLYGAFAGGGALVAYLVVTALGQDHRSKSLKRFAESKLTKPRRVVRR